MAHPATYKYSLPGSVKDMDTRRGIVTAYASAFGNEDSDGDIIEKGAYKKTIEEQGPTGAGRVKMLYMHRFDEPVGKVLSLTEDDHGLLFEAQLLRTQRGQDVLKLYEADLVEHSVGIDIIRRKEEDRRRIAEVRLWEVSPVTWGANPNTPTVALKGTAGYMALADQVARLRKALRLGLTDETAADFELGLAGLEATLRTYDKSHAPAPSAETPPMDGTSADGGPRSEGEWLKLLVNRL